MKTYRMPETIWFKIRDSLNPDEYAHVDVDRWLEKTYNLRAVAETWEDAANGVYPFKVLDKKSLTMFLLRWS